MADTKGITPNKGTKAIVSGLDKQARAFARALMSEDDKHPGYTLDEARVRIIAAGAPIWNNMYGRTDLRFMVSRNPGERSKAGGGTHLFMHTEAKGKRTYSKGIGNEPDNKDVHVPSVGDEERRWKHIGGDMESLPKNVTNRAKRRLSDAVEQLQGEGYTNEQIAETPFFEWCINAGLVELTGGKAKGTTKRRRTRRSSKAKQEAAA